MSKTDEKVQHVDYFVVLTLSLKYVASITTLPGGVIKSQ